MKFLDDCAEALKGRDVALRTKLLNSAYSKGFYNNFWKGLGIRSITEPIIKFLIFSELCSKYQIISEDNSYNDSKLLDLALYIEPIDYLDEQEAEVGIELKWTKLTKNGRQYTRGIDSFLSDFNKMKKASNRHKYIIQLAFAEKKIELNLTEFNDQMSEIIDGRSIKKIRPNAIKIAYFPTWDDSYETQNFVMVLWKLVEVI